MMSATALQETFTAKEIADLTRAKTLLEQPGFAIRVANRFGTPIEAGLKLLPARVSAAINVGTQRALTRALDIIVKSMGSRSGASTEKKHKFLASLSGGV